MNNQNLIVGQHYPSIDGLRGIAVLLVVWFHATSFGYETSFPNAPFLYYTLGFLGATGVNLFFVLSGFLITGILIDISDMKGKFKKFYIRRALRIFPLYYAVLLITFCLFLFFLEEQNYFKWVTHIFYLQNWSVNFYANEFKYIDHLWSLAVEEQFYIIWPMLFFSVYNKNKPQYATLLCVLTIILAWLSHLMFVHYGYYKLAYMSTLTRMDGLLLGALLSIICVHYNTHLHRFGFLAKYICIIMFLLTLCSLLIPEGISNKYVMYIFIGVTCSTVFYAGLLWSILLSQNTGLQRAFSVRLLREVGRISYGLYIFHVPFMLVVSKFLVIYHFDFWLNHFLILVLGGGGALITAFISYRYFEKPILRLKDKYAPLKQAD